MFASGLRHLVRVVATTVAAGLVFATLAAAQTTPKSAVDQFLANPSQVMAQYSKGGADLISLIRDVATSHPEALQTIVGLLATGNVDQQSAIGSGLGQAYKIVLNTDQNYATQIATAIGNSKSDNAKTAYSGATGDVLIGSTGGGPGGGGGGGGGGSGGPTGTGGVFGGGNSGSGPNGASNFQTSSRTFTGGGGGVSGTTSSGSVSPRR